MFFKTALTFCVQRSANMRRRFATLAFSDAHHMASMPLRSTTATPRHWINLGYGLGISMLVLGIEATTRQQVTAGFRRPSSESLAVETASGSFDKEIRRSLVDLSSY